MLLGAQPVRSQPVTSTKVRYCNRTSQAINAAIGTEPDFTAMNWRRLKPDACHEISLQDGYSGEVCFFVRVNGIRVKRNRPTFTRIVSPGMQCYQYIRNDDQFTLESESCF